MKAIKYIEQTDEIYEMFVEEYIGHVKNCIDHWMNATARTEKEKLEGLAFSILVGLDGLSGDFSGSFSEADYSINDSYEKFYEGIEGDVELMCKISIPEYLHDKLLFKGDA